MTKDGIGRIKCVVWDLDGTIWSGVLLEDDSVELRDSIKGIISELDQRGILQSIASRNKEDMVLNKLKEFQLDQFFLYPQIGWDNKSDSIKEIAMCLNIGTNSIAFVDDQTFELEEVNYNFPEVLFGKSYRKRPKHMG